MIKNDVGDAFGGGGNYEVVHLPADKDSLSTNNTRVQTWFMYGWFKVDLAENLVRMIFSQAWRLRVSLECAKTWHNLSRLKLGAFEMMNPPIAECMVRTDVDTLFWGRGFIKFV